MLKRLFAVALVLSLLSGVARAQVITLPTFQTLITQVQSRAGYIPEPYQNPVIIDAVNAGYLEAWEMYSSDFEYFVWTGSVYDENGEMYSLRAMVQTDKKEANSTGKKGDDDSWFRKLVVMVAEKVTDKVVGHLVSGGLSLMGACLIVSLKESEFCLKDMGETVGNLAIPSLIYKFVLSTYEGVELSIRQRRVLKNPTKSQLLVLTVDSKEGQSYGIFGETGIFMDVAPQIPPKDGRVIVPLRFLEHAGLDVKWNAEDQSVTLTRPSDGLWAKYFIGQTKAETSEGLPLSFDIAPQIIDGRTMIGLRSALSPFCQVNWQTASRRVILECAR